MVLIEPIPAFNDNYIWLAHLHGQAFVVDPGDATPVVTALEERSLQLQAILITHHHHDHIGGIPELVSRYPGVRVYAPSNPQIENCTDVVRDQDIISLEMMSLPFRVLSIPGHTLDHIAYYAQGMLFCGDTLFSAGCGRLFEGTAEQMYHSLQKLKALPDTTDVYCAHEYTQSNIDFALSVDSGNEALKDYNELVKQLRQDGKPSLPSNMAQEKMVNPFLRTDNAHLMKTLQIDNNPVECFRKLRSMKDVF